MLQVLCVEIFKAEIRRFLEGGKFHAKCKIFQLNLLSLELIDLNPQNVDEKSEKKPKVNPCVTCFGIFDLIDEILRKIRHHEELPQYEVNRFFTSLHLPLSLNLVQLQMWLALLEKFPEMFSESKTPDLSVKDVLKHILNEKLGKEIEKEFQVDGLLINIHLTLDTEVEMLENLIKAAPNLMAEWNSRK